MSLTIILILTKLFIEVIKNAITMYVCLCKNVTDSEIRSSVSAGACSLRQVRDQLGVASQCGKCGKMANQIVKQTLETGTLISR